jgi:hypothetical protein
MTRSLFALPLPSLLASLLILAAPIAAAGDFEPPPLSDAAALLGPRAAGVNYRVISPVQSDGLLRIYDIETSYGPLRAEGDAVLEVRLRELAAITALEEVEGTDQFAEGLRIAASQPLEFVGDAIDDPMAAARNTVSGASRLFRRAASGVRNLGTGQSQDNVADSLLGVNAAKRELAVELGVDPYTDYPPLASRLEQAARASALGGLTVRGVLMLMPGAVAAVASTASTASSVADLIKAHTPSELREINHARLQEAGVSPATIGLFLDNPAYTPSDQTIFAGAVGTLGSVSNVELFVVRAAAAGTRDLAIFHRRRAELLSHYNATAAPLRDFMMVAGVPLNSTMDGRIVVLFPLDIVSWTDLTGGIADAIAAELQGAAVEVIVSGTVTPFARAQFEQLGWTLTEGLAL